MLIGTNVIRASRRDQHIARGSHYLQKVREQNPAWYTAFIDTDTSEPGNQQGTIGYAKYMGRFPRLIPPGKEVDVVCEAPRVPGHQPYTTIVEGLPRGSSCLKVCNLVADVSPSRRVPVRLCNISAKPMTLTRNCKVAQLSSFLRAEDAQPNLSYSIGTKEDGQARSMSAVEELDEIIPCLDLSKATLADESEENQLNNLLRQHSDIFSKSSLDFGRTMTIKHSIPLIDNQPFRIPYRRVPPSQYQAVKEHLKGMLDTEAIRRSNSPYASPMVIVYKKDGSL